MKNGCAIVAMDVINALGAGVENVWAAIMDRTCGIRKMRRFGEGVYRTDFSGELPDDAEALLNEMSDIAPDCRAARLACLAGRRALAGAHRETRIGLVLSTTKAEIGQLEREATTDHPARDTLAEPFELARFVAAHLGLTGPVLAVSNACASGLVALAQAARMIERGDAAMMLVVGVDVLSEFILSGFSALCSLSPSPCRPYDETRAGLSLGEGAGAMLLASTADAPLATVRGWGVTNDANHITGPSRTGDGLKAAIARALEAARLTPADIAHVNGHGTGTVYNDEMEAKAVSAAFAGVDPPLVNSLKGYFGHTLGAAGVIEAALCVRAMLRHCAPQCRGIVPACLGLARPGVSGPLRLALDHTPVEALTNVATLKSGFGGINAALVLSTERG